MSIVQDLGEKLGRYKRVCNEDLIKTLDDLDAMFQIDGSVFAACNCPNAAEYLFAREGMRTYRHKLENLIEETEAEIESAKDQEKQQLENDQ